MTRPDGGATGPWEPLFAELADLQLEVDRMAGGRRVDRAEGTRYLGRLLAAALARVDGARGSGIDWNTPRIGGFNPDQVFGHARLVPGASYRIHGSRGDAHRLALTTHAGMLASGPPIGHLGDGDLTVGSDGRLEVVVGEEVPHDDGVARLATGGRADTLLVRQLVLRPGDRPARLELERLDTPSRPDPATLTPERQQHRLDTALLFVSGAARRFFSWTRAIAGLTNTIDEVPATIAHEVRADPDTVYLVGYFDLADDEELEIRLRPPPCDYWGLHTTNHWLEPLEHPGLVCHRNHATSPVAPDGTVTLVVSPSQSAHPGALHTLGHRNGAIFHRITGARGPVRVPECRVRRR